MSPHAVSARRWNPRLTAFSGRGAALPRSLLLLPGLILAASIAPGIAVQGATAGSAVRSQTGGEETAEAAAPDGRFLEDAEEFVRACCALPPDALPEIRLVDPEEGTPYCRYIRSGEALGGTRLERPALLLRRDAAALPPVELRVLLLRETLRYRIEAFGPPERLHPPGDAPLEEIRQSFALSGIPEPDREAAARALAERAGRLREQVWIGEEVVRHLRDEPKSLEALRREARDLEDRRRDLDLFWSRAGTVTVADRSHAYAPLPPEEDPHSGEYECIQGPRCHASGTYHETQSDPYGGITVLCVHSPYEVEVTESTMVIVQTSTTTTPPRRLEYTTSCETCERHPMPWSHSESVSTAELRCRLSWDGERGEGVCESRARTSSQIITNQHGGTTIPASDALTSARGTARLVAPGRLELTLPGGTTLLQRRP